MSGRKIGVMIHTTLRDKIITPQDQARLNGLGEVIWTESEAPISVEEAIRLLQGCEVGVGSWGTPHPGSSGLLEACPDLRMWEHAAGTVKAMFGPHLEGHDLMIASCKTAIADNVAEMVLAEIILGLRRVLPTIEANRYSIAGSPPRLKVLFGATIGIVGASEVGKRVLALLRPFRCRPLLYDPYVTPEEAQTMGAELVSDLMELCAASDVVSLHTPDLPSTHKIMGAKEFQTMRDDAIFLNTARGNCVDESALIAELEKGRLFAFLDVSTPEPPALDSPLRQLPNAVYTSHIAGGPSFNIGKQAVDDIAAYLAGNSPLCVVTEDLLDRIA